MNDFSVYILIFVSVMKSVDLCRYGKVKYSPGETFMDEDGRYCTCVSSRKLSCTKDFCYINKTPYKVGDEFPKGDGCNTCRCVSASSVSCSENTCNQECRHKGKWYNAGSRYPAEDGCNECICTTHGVPQCTMYKCYPDCTHNGRTYKKGDTFPKGDKCNNYCTCSVIGEVECSQDLSCFPDCVYKGRIYKAGEKIRSADGCHLCRCGTNGRHECTERLC
ncbi:kielin/chordin-like protein isoform X2 [Ostrea edulis]|uniref:kielin/chordin-like protein isoform X2 n=1 Tax=Ostrea edulis TaxID=37623 RepID=UPI0024AEDA20|nr:kielin/chordin-like protein isoform X2 [Ostrea edulis]